MVDAEVQSKHRRQEKRVQGQKTIESKAKNKPLMRAQVAERRVVCCGAQGPIRSPYY